MLMMMTAAKKSEKSRFLSILLVSQARIVRLEQSSSSVFVHRHCHGNKKQKKVVALSL